MYSYAILNHLKFLNIIIFYFLDLYAKYNCTYCQEDITGLRVKCVECQYFDLCLQVDIKI